MADNDDLVTQLRHSTLFSVDTLRSAAANRIEFLETENDELGEDLTRLLREVGQLRGENERLRAECEGWQRVAGDTRAAAYVLYGTLDADEAHSAWEQINRTWESL